MITRFLTLVIVLILIITNSIHAQTDDPEVSETSLGRWLTDAIRIGTNADCAIITAVEVLGATNFEEANPTRVTSVAPEPIVVINVTGKEIENVILSCLKSYPRKSLRFPHVSGLSAVYTLKDKQLTNLKINDILIEANKTYRVATTDFLANGMFNNPIIDEQKYVLSALIESYNKLPTKPNSNNQRIKFQ